MAKNRKRLLAVLVSGALAGSLAACGGSDDNGGGGSSNSSSAKGGTLYYLMEDPIEHLDPQRVYVGRDISNLSRTVYRTLVTFPLSQDAKTSNTPVPDLATDTGTDKNGGREWSFTVRDGVKWEDGKPITCEDFKYGASRVFATDVITGGPNYLLSYLDIPTDKDGLPKYKGPYTKVGQQYFDKAVTCDGNTITYRFNKPWPDFPLAIAALHMLDPYRQDKDQGNKSNFQIFSNGPYKLDGTWSKNSGGTLVRNTNYDPATDETKSRNALPDKIEFQIGDSPETIYDRLIRDSGDDQYAITGNRVPPSKFAQVVQDRYMNVQSPYVDYLVPNFDRLKDPAVRKALAMATNKSAWIQAGGGEKAYVPAQSVVNPAVVGYQPNPSFADIPEAGDAAAAKQILADAGIKTPIPIKFTYPQSDTADKQAAALKQTWDQAGFQTSLDPLGATYYDVIQKPDKDSDVMWGGWGADWPSAITVTPPLFDSRPNISSASYGQDYGGYRSDEFNGLVDKAANSTSLDQQTGYLQQGDEVLGKDTAYIPLEIAVFNWMWGGKVTNFTTTAASSSYPDLGAIGVQN